MVEGSASEKGGTRVGHKPTTEAGRALLQELIEASAAPLMTRSRQSEAIAKIEDEAREQGRREERAQWLLGEKRRHLL